MLVYGSSMLFMAAVVSSLVSALALRAVHNAASTRIQDIGTQFVRLLDYQLWEQQRHLDHLQASPRWLEPAARQEARQALIHFQAEESPVFSWLAVVRRDGTIAAANHAVLEGLSLAGSRLAQGDLCQAAISDEHGGAPLHPWFPQALDGHLLQFVYVSRPLITGQDQCQGAVVALMGWEWARQLQVLLVAPLASEERKELFVVAGDGRVLLAPPESRVPERLPRLPIAGLRPGDARIEALRWPDGRDYLTSLHRTSGHADQPGLDWLVVARQPLREAHAPAHALARSVFLGAMLLGGLGLAISWRLAGWLSAPLQRLSLMGQSLAPRPSEGGPAVEESANEFSHIDRALRLLHSENQQQRLARVMAEHQAIHDPLTALVNRRGLEDFLIKRQASLQAGDAGDAALVVLSLDLDHFKAVNDRYGHGAGDRLLQTVADRLRRVLRAEDLAVRLGGDEFLVLMPTAAFQAPLLGRQVAARLLQELSQPVVLAKAQIATVGVSIGMAVWPLDGPDIRAVIQKADEHLYAAKGRGRGCLAAECPEGSRT